MIYIRMLIENLNLDSTN